MGKVSLKAMIRMFGKRMCFLCPFALGLIVCSILTDQASGETALDLTRLNQRETTDLETDTWRALRLRGLLDEAEKYCRVRIEKAEPGSDAQTRWTIRLAAVLTDRALSIDTAEAWTAAATPCDQYLKAYPQSPRTPWVRLQRYLVDVSASKDLVLRLLAAPTPDKIRPVALQLIRQTYDQLEKLANQVRELRQVTSSNQRAVTLDADELRGLLGDILFPMSELLLLRSQCYPSASNDSIAAAVEADRLAAELLEDWPAQTARGLMALRMRVLAQLTTSHLKDAADYSQLLKQSNDPQDLAACVRVAIAQEKWDEIPLLVARGAYPHGELALVQLIAMNERGARREVVTDEIKRIEKEFGAYWRRRAELELLKSMPRSSDETPLLMQARAVQLVGEGKLDEAADLFVKTTEKYLKSNDPNAAMDTALQAAAVLVKREKFLPAIKLLQITSLAVPEHPKAAAAHLQAAYMMGQQPQSVEAFFGLLGEQLQNWPDDPVSEKAIVWLEEQGVRQDRHSDAAIQLLKLPPNSEQTPRVVATALRLWVRYCREQWNQDAEQVRQTVGKAIELLEQFSAASEKHRHVCMAAMAQMRLAFDSGSAPPLEPLSDPWLESLRKLRSGQKIDAPGLAAVTDSLNEDQRWLAADVARAMVRAGRNAIESPRATYGSSLLQVLSVAPSFGDALWLRAHALGWSEQWDEATTLAKKLPGEISACTTESVAEYWGKLPERRAQDAAISLWDDLSKQTALGSPKWYVAKRRTAELLIATKRLDEAKVLLDYVIAVAPDQTARPFIELRSSVSAPALR